MASRGFRLQLLPEATLYTGDGGAERRQHFRNAMGYDREGLVLETDLMSGTAEAIGALRAGARPAIIWPCSRDR
jgi:hypothetical protein